MKNRKILTVGSGACILALAIAQVCLGQPLFVKADEPNPSELFDYRQLDMKFTNRNEDFIMNFKQEFSPNNDPHYDPIYITADEFNEEPGTIIASDPDISYAISVPEIKQDGKATNKLDNYGVLEIYKYSYSEDLYETWHAESELILFDKSLFYDHPIAINALMVNGGPYAYSNLPMLEYCLFSADYSTAEETKKLNSHEVEYYYGYFRDNPSDNWRGQDLKGASFTENSIDFSKDQLDKLIRQSELCNLLCRDRIKNLDHGDSFDIESLFNTFSGPTAGMFEIKGGLNGFDYIYPANNHAVVIAINENKIYIGVSARYPWGGVKANVDTDIIYTDLVFEDETTDPEMVDIGYQILTRNTLDELLRLLMDPDVVWSNVNVLDLGVD